MFTCKTNSIQLFYVFESFGGQGIIIMALIDLHDQLQVGYDTENDDIVNDFYIPCLKNATLYRRSVGFFTSNGLNLASKGIAHLISNGGTIQLICSPKLEPEDIEAINSGYKGRDEVIKEVTQRSLVNIKNEIAKDRLEALAWLVSSGAMDIKLAIKLNKDGQLLPGLFHKKVGIFSDDFGNTISFTGSANETVGGLITNYEDIEISCSWGGGNECKKVDRAIALFEDHWKPEPSGHWSIVNFTETSKEIFKQYTPSVPPKVDPEEHQTSIFEQDLNLPPLFDHQQKALNSWFDNGLKGIFEMCTGAGKTITALKCVVEFMKQLKSEGKSFKTVIIACPTQVLVEQWNETIKKCIPNANILLAYDSARKYETKLPRLLKENDENLNIIVTTYATSLSSWFVFLLKQAQKKGNKSLYIADEMHNITSTDERKKLKESGTYYEIRLGLSATPEIEGNPAATNFLFEFFKGDKETIVHSFTLQEAIDKGILCKYKYYPRPIFLDTDKSIEYLKILKDITSGEETKKIDISAYGQRRDFLRKSGIYIAELEVLLAEKGKLNHTLVFCPPGKGDKGDDQRILGAVKQVFERYSLYVGSITAKTPMKSRPQILLDFDSGEYPLLLAIGCLDEGMDIPSTQKAIMLFSVDKSKQFIQRRGRVLRKHQDKEYAEIYDFIILPHGTDMPSEIKEKIIEKELRRYTEFATMAINYPEADKIIQKALAHAVSK